MTRQQAPLHPIAELVTRHLVGSRETLELTDDGRTAVRERLKECANPLELAHAVHSLVAMAAHLELDHGAVDAADTLLAISRRTGTVLGGHVIRRRRASRARPARERRAKPIRRRAPDRRRANLH